MKLNNLHASRVLTKIDATKSQTLPDIVVFSHLRWEFVKQRPQHIMSRLAQHQKIFFIEEPIPKGSYPEQSARVFETDENVTVIQPRIEWEDFKSLANIVKLYTYLEEPPIVWFYSAAFYPVLDYLEPSLVVYDCMDELSGFLGAPASLIQRERRLLSQADLVFTGGKSLYDHKRQFNSHTHCFPSSVDVAHFRKAFARYTPIPQDITHIPHPIAGFYGVIDERLDLELLSETAQLLPEISFAMIGPVVKISETDLPRRSNIHYLGNKAYELLPNYLKAIDIAIMPFALNKSTRFISPTKTLEFLAAEKPIISTPVHDVKRDYSNVVTIVDSATAFRKGLESYLNETPASRLQRRALQRTVTAQTSWDQTVAEMRQLMWQRLGRESLQTSAQTFLTNLTGSHRLQLDYS